MQVQRWMTQKPVCVSPDASAASALEQMAQGCFRYLPVVDGGKLLGIVSRNDLRRARAPLGQWELSSLLEKLPVAELMRWPVVVAHPDELLEDAALRLSEHRVGALPVVARPHGGSAPAVLGILTTKDVVRAYSELASPEQGHTERLLVRTPDRPGAIAAMTGALATRNIWSLVSGTREGELEVLLRVGPAETGACAQEAQAQEKQTSAASRLRDAGFWVEER